MDAMPSLLKPSAKPRWIGLFRGVNVGGNNKLPMKELPKLLESDEIHQVRTYIASGNLLFRADLSPLGIERRIGDAIETQFGFRPPLFLVALERLEKLIAKNPYRERQAQGKGQHFFFLKAPAKSADLELLNGLKANDEEFMLTNEVLYLYAPEGIGRSKLVTQIGRAIEADMTARNLNTVMALRDLAKGM
jgi:uncharacterized protein (DUF1697 family)